MISPLKVSSTNKVYSQIPLSRAPLTRGYQLVVAQSASDCQQTMAAIARVPDVTSHSLQHQLKTWVSRLAAYFLGANTV